MYITVQVLKELSGHCSEAGQEPKTFRRIIDENVYG
jgi:hypothetical protein